MMILVGGGEPVLCKKPCSSAAGNANGKFPIQHAIAAKMLNGKSCTAFGETSPRSPQC